MAEPRKNDKSAKRAAKRKQWQELVEKGATVYFGACRRMAATISRVKRKRREQQRR